MSFGFIGIWMIVLGLVSGTVIHQPAAPAATIQPEVTQASDLSANTLASCLNKSGAILYGAYWCPHCADQKEYFGAAVSGLNYVECDAKGPQGDPDLCQSEGIEAYPTWKMPGKPSLQGAQTLQQLAAWSGCES